MIWGDHKPDLGDTRQYVQKKSMKVIRQNGDVIRLKARFGARTACDSADPK